jgi:23S rRNA (adenine2030-N6)-methyltransferase
MNYRHAFHAGNFADVLKHAVVALGIAYLKRKDAPFRVIDTHAGSGRYDLTSSAAQRTGEWHDGIGRLLGPDAAPLPPPVAHCLAPYLDVVRAHNPAGAIGCYPGSPAIALALVRPQDFLVANELNPEAAAELREVLGKDRRAKVLQLDGWIALRALLPPKERRGLVLIDPPFEEEGELSRCTEGLAEGLKRFSTGVFILWYPIKDPKPIKRFHAALASLNVDKLMKVELFIRRPTDNERLNGCGMVIANPPFILESQLQKVLPVLVRRLGADASAHYRIAWAPSAEITGAADLRRERPRRTKR